MSGNQIVKKCLQDGYANCTPKCNSSEHTFTLITALTQDRPQEEILAWIARHCNAPGRSRDIYGRSVLHMAASLGMVDICNWLLTYKGANLNGRDKESCYTALHRCIVYGQLRTAIFFLKQGANLALTDYNGLTALDLLVMDKPLHLNYSKSAPLETYVWGNNSNYNLGTGDNSSRSSPDLIESFRKQNISIKKVAFQKFHTGFLSSTGTVYTCGHGRGGRLGNRSEMSILEPKPVLIGACTDIALGVDHSLFLAQSGVVFSCGHNTYHQLGQQPPPSRLLAPAPVQGPKKPAKGVAAARYHSVFWTEDSVFTWGLNAGQLGHLKGEKTVILPRLVTGYEMKDSKITQVALSDGSSVICTNKGDIIALHGYTSKKIGHKQFGIEKIEVTGGHLDPAVDPGDKDNEIDFKLVAGGGSPLHIYVLRQGQVLVWTEGKEKNFLSCTLSVSKPQPTIIDISAFRNGCLLVSKDGEVWESCIAQFTAQNSSIPAKRATSPVQDRFVPAARTKSMKETCVSLKVKRIPGIHRAVFATSDPKGKTFCVLQVSPSEALTEIPEITKSSMTKDMTDLYNQMSECDDVHDVVCVVQGVRFPAHSAVIAAGADLLGKKLKCLEDEAVPAILEIDNVDPVIFRQLLEYIYTKSCPLLQEGPCAIAINVPDSNDKDVDSKIAITENTKKDELTLELDEDPATVSAYAVYERNRKKKAKELKKPSENEYAEKKRNPLALFQEAGKKLGLYGIGKIVDCFRYDDGVIYKRSNPVIGQLDFNLQNLMFLADVTLVAEDGVEFYAHKSILVARSEYFNAMLTSGWIESKEENSLNLMIKSCYLEAILEYLYRDQCKTLSQSDDTEFISNLLVHADQLLLVRLRELCENELAKLITLKNVAEMLEFTFVYMAEQLKRSCLQFVVLNLGCLLESQALNNLEDEVLEALDHYYRETNNKVASRRITPIQGYPTNKDIESEYDSNPLTFDQLLQQEDSVFASGKPRTRRNSSGEKKKSPKLRNRNSSIRLSGSSIGTNSGSEDEDSISQDMESDRVSLLDFDIEEKEELSPEPVERKTSEEKVSKQARDTSFFANLLGAAADTSSGKNVENFLNTSQKDNGPWKYPPVDNLQDFSLSQILSSTSLNESGKKDSKPKKFTKLSQKERKRLEEEKAKTGETVPVSPAGKSWTGWSPASTPSNQPSLMDIMLSQANNGHIVDKSPETRQSDGKKQQPTKDRRLSEDESGSKTTKRKTWKQLEIGASPEKSMSGASPSPPLTGNPWKLSTSASSPALAAASPSNIIEEQNRSFLEIMEQDVKEEETVIRAVNKPLHMLQLEEQAMLELHQLYSLQYPDEVITVARVEQPIVSAKPVWKYKL